MTIEREHLYQELNCSFLSSRPLINTSEYAIFILLSKVNKHTTQTGSPQSHRKNDAGRFLRELTELALILYRFPTVYVRDMIPHPHWCATVSRRTPDHHRLSHCTFRERWHDLCRLRVELEL